MTSFHAPRRAAASLAATLAVTASAALLGIGSHPRPRFRTRIARRVPFCSAEIRL